MRGWMVLFYVSFFVGVAAAGNLLTNEGFESWVEILDNWSISGKGLGTEIERETVLEGEMSCKLIWTTTTTRWILQKVSVTADTKYDFSFWILDNDPYGRIRGTLRWFRADGSLISSDNTPYSVDATGWQELTLTATAPTDADTVRVEIRVYDVDWGDTIVSASVYVDSAFFGVTGGENLLTDGGFET